MVSDHLTHAARLIVVAGLTLAAIAARADDSAADRIDAWLSGVETLSAGFEQQLFDESGQVLGDSRGTMTLKRPGLFRWHYTEPSELLVVSDGQKIWSYDVELENVTVIEQSEALTGSPAQLLAGAGSVAQGFDVGASWSTESVAWYELKPRSGQPDFRIVRLGLDGERLAGMELHDQLGQVTRISFQSVQRNLPVSDDDFSFAVPDGVDVIVGSEGHR